MFWRLVCLFAGHVPQEIACERSCVPGEHQLCWRCGRCKCGRYKW